jgi:hypothetical protein
LLKNLQLAGCECEVSLAADDLPMPMHSILNFTNTTIAGLLAQAPNATYTNDSTIRASPSSYRPLDELILGVADQRHS